jgi:hypothetical protein
MSRRYTEQLILHVDPVLKSDIERAAHQLTDAWAKERARNQALKAHQELGLSLHGLRATAVIRLRRAGVSRPLIGDFIGMSSAMVDRYCRRSEQRDNALAAINQMQAQVIKLNRIKHDNSADHGN